jgi:hypothetical protein
LWLSPVRDSANGCFYFSLYQQVFAWCLRRSVGRGLAEAAALVGLLSLCFIAGCTHSMSHHAAPLRDINAVLADHDDELLAIPGVVGVYVGLLRDDKTACLKVMLVRKDARLNRRLPRTLEGYRVVTEVTGEIRPLK